MKIALRPKAVHLLPTIDLGGDRPVCCGASTAVQARKPSSIRDWRHAAVALTTGAAVFVLHAPTPGIHRWLVIALDAAGLSFFAVAGATKALESRLQTCSDARQSELAVKPQ